MDATTTSDHLQRGAGTPGVPGVALADIKQPAQAFVVVDTARDGDCHTAKTESRRRLHGRLCALEGCGYFTYQTASSKRHNDGLNAGFADGHSKWFSVTVFNNRNATAAQDLWGISRAPMVGRTRVRGTGTKSLVLRGDRVTHYLTRPPARDGRAESAPAESRRGDS